MRASSTHQATVDDLSGGLLHLPQLGDEVPEAGLGHDMVGGEDPHPVERGGRVLGRGQQTPNNFILPKLEAQAHTSEHLTTTQPRHTHKQKLDVLNLEFTFKGTAASEKGDKGQVTVRTPDKITPRRGATFGLGCRDQYNTLKEPAAI